MRLYIDLRTNQLMRAPGITGSVSASQIQFKRGRSVPLEVQFLRDGTDPVRIAANTLEFAVKPVGEFDSAPLVVVSDWTIPLEGDENPVYVAYPSFTTAAINALFSIDADPANDVASIELQGEVNWRQDSGPIASTDNFRLIVLNDILRPDDIAPTPLDPPDAYERKSNRGEPDGYASLNASAVVVGVPVQINMGFPFAPETADVDAVYIAQSVEFPTTGHLVECTGAPVTPVAFELFADAVKIADIDTAEGVGTFSLLATLTTANAATKFRLVAPAAVISAPFTFRILLKGLTV
jgi:hypothetical protein